MMQANLVIVGGLIELVAFSSVDPAPQKEHLGYRMIALEVDDMQKATDYLDLAGTRGTPLRAR
jgi:hypothetical protein